MSLEKQNNIIAFNTQTIFCYCFILTVLCNKGFSASLIDKVLSTSMSLVNIAKENAWPVLVSNKATTTRTKGQIVLLGQVRPFETTTSFRRLILIEQDLRELCPHHCSALLPLRKKRINFSFCKISQMHKKNKTSNI